MKRIFYIVCLTTALYSCNNDYPIDNLQERQMLNPEKESNILNFKNSEEFLSTIENFDLNKPILTRSNSNFISAENVYEQESTENQDNEHIGFLIPDEKYRHFFNKDLEIIVNDTIYKVTKYGTLLTHISSKTTLGASLSDNDFVGKPEIVSCEAIVYTKDGNGWIGAKVVKK